MSNTPANSPNPTRQLLKDYGLAVMLAVFVALLIRFFLFEAYRIPSHAMKPTLEPGDTIFASKWPFGLRFPGATAPLTRGRLPVRGEVVIFSSPTEPRLDYIKRVIGLPGDTIAIRRNRILLNGLPLESIGKDTAPCGKERLPEGKTYPICSEAPLLEDFGPDKVPSNSVFVIGDLRTAPPFANTDPRKAKSWGMVPLSSLKGSAICIWLSIEPRGFDHTGWFPRIRFERMFRRID